MCVFVRVPGRTSDFFWLFFFRSVLWRPAAIIWCVNPFVLRHFFAFWIFCFFCSVFVFALGLPGRGRVRILFFAVFVLPFFVCKTLLFCRIFFAFRLFCFFCSVFVFASGPPGRPRVRILFLRFLCCLCVVFFGVYKPFCFEAFFCISDFLLFLFRFCVCFFARPLLLVVVGCCWLLLEAKAAAKRLKFLEQKCASESKARK